mgnify:FL=1
MKRNYDKLMDSRMDSTEDQFKQLNLLLHKINVMGNWNQRHDIVDMSFQAKKLVESLEEKFNL